MPDCASCGHPRGDHGPFWPDGCYYGTAGDRCDCTRWIDQWDGPDLDWMRLLDGERYDLALPEETT